MSPMGTMTNAPGSVTYDIGNEDTVDYVDSDRHPSNRDISLYVGVTRSGGEGDDDNNDENDDEFDGFG